MKYSPLYGHTFTTLSIMEIQRKIPQTCTQLEGDEPKY